MFEYCEAKARDAVHDQVNKVVEAVAKSYYVSSTMLGGLIGRCFNGVDEETYDSDGHYIEQVVYDSEDYNLDGEYVGHDNDEDDGDSDW